MQQTAIFGPFFAMMLLTLVVWVYMYVKRIAFIQGGQITPNLLSALALWFMRSARRSPTSASPDEGRLLQIGAEFLSLRDRLGEGMKYGLDR